MSEHVQRSMSDEVRQPAEAPVAPSDYKQIGAQVTAVLASAEQAAEEIRRGAREEASRVVADARERAAAIVADASAQTAESREEAERVRADAEEQAREMLARAEETAQRIEEGGLRRKAALAEEAKRFEERLEDLVAVFRAMTSQLEELLRERDADGHQPIDDSLEDSLAARRVQAG